MIIVALLLAVSVADTPEAAFERYRTKINSHDFDQLASDVIAGDALFIFSGDSHRGLDAARAAFNRTWSIIPDEVYTMDKAEWVARDASSATVTFRYSYRGTMKDGKALAGGGFGTNLYKLTPTGWRLAYEHLSHDVSPAQ
jgi:ketosteroid isomerase-like protein